MEEYAYWIHKLDKLWKEVEEIKKRLEKIEREVENIKLSSFQPQTPDQPQQPSVQQPQAQLRPKIAYSDPVLKILSEKGPMNIIDLNAALREEGIGESVRDTLFKRVKKLMEEGKVGFDEKTQTFYIRTG